MSQPDTQAAATATKQAQRAFLWGRIAIGVNFMGHGLVRLPKLDQFASGIEKMFVEAGSMVPQALVYPFAYTLAIVEFVVGIALIVGLRTWFCLQLVFAIMILLLLGSTSIENWSGVGTQMVYVVCLFLLLRYYTPVRLSVDALLER